MISNRIRLMASACQARMLDTRCSILDQTQSDRASTFRVWYHGAFEISVAAGVSPARSKWLQSNTAPCTGAKITPGDEIADARLSIAVDRHAYRPASSKYRRGRAF